MNNLDSIQVPVTFKGVKLKLPFILFVGWTPENRREFVAELRAMLALTEKLPELGKANLPDIALEAKNAKVITDGHFDRVNKFCDNVPANSWEETKVQHALMEEGLATFWIQTQINMMDVKAESWHV